MKLRMKTNAAVHIGSAAFKFKFTSFFFNSSGIAVDKRRDLSGGVLAELTKNGEGTSVKGGRGSVG